MAGQNLITGKSTSGGTVTVYWYGTLTKPTINSSDGGSAKSNPITADFDGSYSFWVDDGHYNIVNGTPTGNLEIRPRQAKTGSAIEAAKVVLNPFVGNTSILNLEQFYEALIAGTFSHGGLLSTGAFNTSANITQTGGVFNNATSNGANLAIGASSEEITLSTSGTTTDSSANLLPANSLILGVVARVTTTITTATDWKLGDPTTAGRFTAANSTLTAGTTDIGILHWSGAVSTLATGPSQAAAAKLRITTTGTPGAGKVRVTVFYLTLTAPTS